jgi:hypothetical protein
MQHSRVGLGVEVCGIGMLSLHRYDEGSLIFLLC